MCGSLGCVHPHNESLHRGLLPRRGPSVSSGTAGVSSILVSLSRLVSFTGNLVCLVTVTRNFPSSVLMSFSLALARGSDPLF